MIVHREENSPFHAVSYGLGGQYFIVSKSEKKRTHELDGSHPLIELTTVRERTSQKDYITRYKTKDSEEWITLDLDNMQTTQTLSITPDVTEVYVASYNPVGPDLELSFTPDSDPERIRALKKMFEVKRWRKT